MKAAIIFTAILLPVLMLPPGYSKDNRTAAGLNSKGMHELEAGNNSAAADFFTRAIELDPSVKYYHNNLAAAYIRMKDYAAAEKHLLIALNMDPGYTRALSNMAVVMFRTGRYSDAYNYYMLAKKSDPSYAEKRFERRKVLARLKELSAENPGDRNLKRIILYIESSEE